jgi:Tfp pilus assembly protein PilX
MRDQLVRRANDESGVALVMALGILLVLMIVVTTVIFFTSANSRHANTSQASQQAFELAEAGLNNASSVLFKASDPSASTAVPAGSTALNGGTISWSGLLLGTIWTLTGTGTVTNPAVPGGTVTRTVTKQFSITLVPAPAWSFNYSDATTGCLTVSNNAVVTAPLYVRGNMCLSNNSHFTGSQLQVKGTLTVNNGASVGYSGTPIALAKLQGGCLSGPHTCTSGDSVYATSLTTTVDSITKPSVDLPGWYQNARPGPKHNCTTGSIAGGFDNDTTYNNSRGTFDLTPSSSYSCVVTSGATTIGQLTWDIVTHVLTVKGTIFFDGPIQVSSATAAYQGQASIYSAGTITFINSARLCGVAACDGTWNPASNLIALVAGASSGTGLSITNNAVYQGVAYVVADYSLVNNAANWGPVIANHFDLSNNSGGFMPINGFPAGTPGTQWSVAEVPGSWNG